MAKRRRNGLDALQGFQMGYSTARGVMADNEMADAAQEKPEEQYTYGDPSQDQRAKADEYNERIAAEDRAAFKSDIRASDYDYGDGKVVTGTKYKFGSTVQDKPFTDSELQGLRMNRMADIAMKYGQPEKAMQLRTQGMQLKGMEQQQQMASYQLNQAKALDDLRAKTADQMEAARNLDVQKLMPLVQQYNANQGAFADGNSIGLWQRADGALMVTNIAPDGTARSVQMTPQLAQQMVQRAYMMQLGQIDPRYAFQNEELGLKRETLDATREYQQGSLGVQRQNADTTERYRADQSEYMQGMLKLRGREAGNSAAHSDLYRYQLEQQKRFDAERERIGAELDAGRITEAEAQKRLNRAALKFGGQMKDQKPGGDMPTELRKAYIELGAPPDDEKGYAAWLRQRDYLDQLAGKHNPAADPAKVFADVPPKEAPRGSGFIGRALTGKLGQPRDTVRAIIGPDGRITYVDDAEAQPSYSPGMRTVSIPKGFTIKQ